MVKRVGDLPLDPHKIRAYVAENFSTELMVNKYLALYEEAARVKQKQIA